MTAERVGKSRYSISTGIDPAAWDDFVHSAPGGHYVQTTQWAALKQPSGWRVRHVVVLDGDSIVAGAQLLVRRLLPRLAVAYVQRAPLLTHPGPVVAETVLSAIEGAVFEERAAYLAIQPPPHGGVLEERLVRAGWPVQDGGVPSATVVANLRDDLDALLSRMKSKTRYNIRRAERKGVHVREGDERDLPTFHRLMRHTAARQRFSPPSLDYFRRAWCLFSGGRHVIKLFIAELEGRPISAILALGYRDTVTYWRGAWSGEGSEFHPNEALHWAAMRWSKQHGYRYYDFEGIDRRVAVSIQQGRSRPDDVPRSVTSFKLGFGGEVRVDPELRYHIPSPLLARLYATVRSSPLRGLVDSARNRLTT